MWGHLWLPLWISGVGGGRFCSAGGGGRFVTAGPQAGALTRAPPSDGAAAIVLAAARGWRDDVEPATARRRHPTGVRGRPPRRPFRAAADAFAGEVA